MNLCTKKNLILKIKIFHLVLVNKYYALILLRILVRFSAGYFSQPDLALEATVLLFASCVLVVLMECLRHHANKSHLHGPFPLRAEQTRMCVCV